MANQHIGYNGNASIDEKIQCAINNGDYLYHEMCMFDEAIAEYHRALDAAPKIPRYTETRSYCYLHIGFCLFRKGEYDAALRKMNLSLELNGKRARAFASKAVTLAKLGRHEEARAAVSRAIELDSTMASRCTQVIVKLLEASEIPGRVVRGIIALVGKRKADGFGGEVELGIHKSDLHNPTELDSLGITATGRSKTE